MHLSDQVNYVVSDAAHSEGTLFGRVLKFCHGFSKQRFDSVRRDFVSGFPQLQGCY